MQSEFRLNKLQLLSLLIVLFATTFAMAQGIASGSISGTIVDPTGAVVSGANVTATNISTGSVLSAQSNESGYFTLRSVLPGTYKVTIEMKGFRTVQVAQVSVQVAKDVILGATKLELSSTGETVEVVESAPILETSTAQVTTSFDSKTTADLPTGGGFDALTLLIPGVADSGSNNFSNTNGAGISSNGLRGRSNNFQIDGQGNNDNSVAGPSIFLANQDLLGEVSVITNDFSVEYGRASGSVVNYITKSGTNTFHGTAFEYWTGSHFDSHDNLEAKSDPIPRYVDNRFGFTVGGPIYRNKAWFFGSALWDRTRSAGTTQTSGSALTPTPTGLTQLAAAFPGNSAVAALNAIGPYAVAAGGPFVFTTPTTLTVSDGPVSDGGTVADIEFAVVGRNPPSLFNDREFTGRVDVELTHKDRVGARYIFTQNILTAATGRFAAGAWVDIPARSQQIALDWVHTFSGNLVNQMRYSFSRSPVPFEGGSFPDCTRANLFGCPTGISLPSSLVSFGMQNNLPQGRTINNTQVQDNGTWSHGLHTFKFGGEYLKQRSPNAFLPNANGTYNFSGSNAGGSCAALFPDLDLASLGTTDLGRVCGFSRFLADIPTLSLTDGSKTLNFKEYDLAGYFGDDWRIKDNLTLNLGLRWEFTSQAVNLLHDLSVANQAGSDPFWDPTLPTSVTTLPEAPNHYRYFGPNFGFAWKPRFLGNNSDRTVIRGGFRLTYDPPYYNMFLNVASAAPVVNAGTISSAACTAPCLPSSGFTGNDVRGAHLQDIPRGVNPGFRNYTQVGRDFHEPMTESWSLGIQHELTNRMVFEIRYVGNHVTGNYQTVNANPALGPLRDSGFSSFIPAGLTPCTTAGTPGNAVGLFGEATDRVSCDFTNIRNRENTSWSTYHGLQSQFRVSDWHGLSGAASFTWSKNMDNTSEIFSTQSGGNTVAGAQNPFDIDRGEKSLSGLDFPKTASIYLVYDLPFYKNQHGFLGKVLGGFQANVTWRYSSGQNWTPVHLAGTNSACQNTFDLTFYGVSTCRPFAGSPSAPVDSVGVCTDPAAADCGLVDFTTGNPTTSTAVRWIYNDDNAAAFFGTPYGNVRRNPGTRSQNISATNFSMFKSTKISERVSFRVEAQVYNLFNHQFRGADDVFIDDSGSSFGNNFTNNSGGFDYTNVTLQGIGRRRMILGAKFVF